MTFSTDVEHIVKGDIGYLLYFFISARTQSERFHKCLLVLKKKLVIEIYINII